MSERGAPGLHPPARAWLLLDIDGVINPIVSNSQARRLGLRRITVPAWEAGTVGNVKFRLLTWVAGELGNHPLLRPAWCTAWWAEANHLIGNRVGLGPWPTVDLGYYCGDPYASKVDGIATMVGTDPFVWIDDDPGDDVDERLAALPGPNLLIRTDPHVGLLHEHLDQASEWASATPLGHEQPH